MDVVVTLEHHFLRATDGGVWTDTQFEYQFWQRYLQTFDNVLVMARVKQMEFIPSSARQADGPRVTFLPIPEYVGPVQFIRAFAAIGRTLTSNMPNDAAYILRVPSPIGGMVAARLRKMRKNYGVEVVGDPWDVFAPGASTHPLRPVFRHVFSLQLRRLCAGSVAAAYVTETHLQERYPPLRNAYRTSYSSVMLPTDVFVESGRSESEKRPLKLITVGSLAQPYKGIDILIKALSICVKRGLESTLAVIGDGAYRQGLEALAAELGIGQMVTFHGQLPGTTEVMKLLDRADLFVLPSRAEGKPRAMIEAMARGLPCIGSTVGGIPELLPDEDLVPPNAPELLADKICEVALHPQRLKSMSERNLKVAKGYHESVVNRRRQEFYEFLRNVSEV